MPINNNVTRLLENRKITFTAYELPPEKRSALETAQNLGVPPEIVYKTIVIVRNKPGKPVLAVIPATKEVDLKAVAGFLGEKKVTLPTQNEAERITGLQSGGISPLALINKGFLVLLDNSASEYDQIHISGGQRGLNIRLPVRSLIELTHATLTSISQ